MTDVTRVLLDIEQGDTKGAEQLLPLVYEELRKLAAQKLAHEKPGQTLQATALVHEAYLRLVGGEADVRWNSRGHFIAAAAEAMRRILVMWQCRSESSPRRSQLEPGFIERGTFCVKRLRRAAVIEIIPWNGSSGPEPQAPSPPSETRDPLKLARYYQALLESGQ